jgi:hypothetical protein
VHITQRQCCDGCAAVQKRTPSAGT